MNVELHCPVQRSSIDIVRTSDAVASSFPGSKYYHRFEAYDFEAMNPNLPDAELQEIMFKLLESTFKGAVYTAWIFI